jgi:WD40 repeat protein
MIMGLFARMFNELETAVIQKMETPISAMTTHDTNSYIVSILSKHANGSIGDSFQITSALLVTDEDELFNKNINDIKETVTIEGIIRDIIYNKEEKTLSILVKKYLSSKALDFKFVFYIYNMSSNECTYISDIPEATSQLIAITNTIILAWNNSYQYITLDSGHTWRSLEGRGFTCASCHNGDVYFLRRKKLTVLRKEQLLQSIIKENVVSIIHYEEVYSMAFAPDGTLYFATLEDGFPYAVSQDATIKVPLLKRRLISWPHGLVELIFIGRKNAFYYTIWEQKSPLSSGNRLGRYLDGQVDVTGSTVMPHKFLLATDRHLFFNRRLAKDAYELSTISRSEE